MKDKKTAVVLLSGGLDSAVSISGSDRNIKFGIIFDYGQKAFKKEKAAAEKLAKYYDFEPKDGNHKDKRILGQYVYFSKINIDNIPHKVRFKIDVPQDADGTLLYAGHRVQKI